MELATSGMISAIDEFAQVELGIPTKQLMQRSGEAVAALVKSRIPPKKKVVILAGKGNNGGDGYSAASLLLGEYDVTVYDIFSSGQKSEEGKYFLNRFKELGGRIVNFENCEKTLSDILNADCIIDAIFGTGFHGQMPEDLKALATAIRESKAGQKIAIDVPLGINADDGSVSEYAISVDATVALSFVKPGIISYPARSYTGEIVYDSLGLPEEVIAQHFSFKYKQIDRNWITENTPKRPENSNKGSFGKLLLITGSEKYRGAAYLTVEAALRGGVGLVSFAGAPQLSRELSQKYPEVVYKEVKDITEFTLKDAKELVELAGSYSAILVGSGSDNTEGLLTLVLELLSSEGAPIILDADAINALASIEDRGRAAIKRAKREVIITPHPLEFARLIGEYVKSVQLHRIEYAQRFAEENNCTVVLKGAATIIADKRNTYINSTGSSALAKAGSGDVLAGLVGAFVAQRTLPLSSAAGAAVYYHGAAGDSLASQFSSYGVTPSDLPKEIARQIAKTENNR